MAFDNIVYTGDQASSDDKAAFVRDIAKHCNAYKGADTGRSLFQLLTTFGLFAGMLAVMAYSLQFFYALTLALSVVTSGLLIRLFIIQHDCGHGSFFNSRKANDWTGRLIGLLTMTPYDFWRRSHNMHHATSGNLDKRGIGAIDTITVKEYQALSPKMRFLYRLYRNPVLFILIGSPLYTMLVQRLPLKQTTEFHEGYKTLETSEIWKSVMLTNLSILAVYGGLSYLLGLGTVAAIYVPVLTITSWIGAWLFYIQHQFEDTIWENQENWSVQEAALMGSSYYVMPKILQWFSGNIGLHHIHHLCSKIPNYKLQECMDARPELSQINRLTLRESLGCTRLKIWDEDQRKMVAL